MWSKVARFVQRSEQDRHIRASFSQRDFPRVLRVNCAAAELAPTIYRARSILHGIEPEQWGDLAPALKQHWIAQATEILTR